MPLTFYGSGTIAGLNAGGLPDACITTDDIAANDEIKSALEVTP